MGSQLAALGYRQNIGRGSAPRSYRSRPHWLWWSGPGLRSGDCRPVGEEVVTVGIGRLGWRQVAVDVPGWIAIRIQQIDDDVRHARFAAILLAIVEHTAAGAIVSPDPVTETQERGGLDQIVFHFAVAGGAIGIRLASVLRRKRAPS